MLFKSMAYPIQRESKDQARRDLAGIRVLSPKRKKAAAFVLGWLLWTLAGDLWAGTPAAQLQELSKYVVSATGALQSGDVRAAKQRFQDFDQGWDRIEDGVRAKSRDVYQKVERAMGNVKIKLVKPNKPDSAAALAALKELKATIDAVLPSLR